MRSRKILLVLGLIGVMGIGLVLSGCSDDDRLTPVEPTINDQYTFVQSEVNGSVDMAVSLIGSVLEVYESNSQITDTVSIAIADLYNSPFDPDSVLTSDDWYILFSNQITSAFGSLTIDSIIFTSNGVSVDLAYKADGIVLRHLDQKSNINNDGSYTDYDVRSEMIVSGMNTTNATISGDWTVTTIDQVVDGDSEITRTYTVDATVNSLVVAKPQAGWGGGCPATGSIDYTVDLSYQNGTADAVTSSWDFTVTFTGGAALVAVSDGTVSASYSRDICTP